MNEPTNLAQARRTAGNLKLASTPVGATPIKRKAVAVRSPRAQMWQSANTWATNELYRLPTESARIEARRFADETVNRAYGL